MIDCHRYVEMGRMLKLNNILQKKASGLTQKSSASGPWAPKKSFSSTTSKGSMKAMPAEPFSKHADASVKNASASVDVTAVSSGSWSHDLY